MICTQCLKHFLFFYTKSSAVGFVISFCLCVSLALSLLNKQRTVTRRLTAIFSDDPGRTSVPALVCCDWHTDAPSKEWAKDAEGRWGWMGGEWFRWHEWWLLLVVRLWIRISSIWGALYEDWMLNIVSLCKWKRALHISSKRQYC